MGQEDTFPGLLGLVYSYLETLDVDERELTRIHEYLNLVKHRADGAYLLVSYAANSLKNERLDRHVAHTRDLVERIRALAPCVQARFGREPGNLLRPDGSRRRDVRASLHYCHTWQ